MVDTVSYLKLFTHYYKKDSVPTPKLKAMTELLLKPFIDLQNIMPEYCEKLDVRTADGIYLDMIGKILGYSRILPFQPISTDRTILTDDEYRKLLQARQFIGRWDGTTTGFEELWASSDITSYQVYGLDNNDMSVTYGIMGKNTNLEAEVMTRPGYFPHTAGVGLNIFLMPMVCFGFLGYGEEEPEGEVEGELNHTGFCDYTDSKEKVGMCIDYSNGRGLLVYEGENTDEV